MLKCLQFLKMIWKLLAVLMVLITLDVVRMNLFPIIEIELFSSCRKLKSLLKSLLMVNLSDIWIVRQVYDKTRNDFYQSDLSDDSQFAFEYMSFLLFKILHIYG